jgi:adenylate cyclase class IV
MAGFYKDDAIGKKTAIFLESKTMVIVDHINKSGHLIELDNTLGRNLLFHAK